MSFYKKRKKLLEEKNWDRLVEYAKELGIYMPPQGKPIDMWADKLVDRIIEAERNIYISRTWVISVISALAALTSAIAAWFAVFWH